MSRKILSGANLNDVSLTLFIQNFMIMCIGGIDSFGFIKAKYLTINYIFIIMCVIDIIISIIPIKTIKKLNVNELIRSGE